MDASEGERPEIGGYEVLEPLGAGAMGRVWAGRARASGAAVAIKVLPPARPGAGPDRFLVEVEATARVVHENVVRLLDAGALASGERYLVLERVDGASLADLLRARALGPRALAAVLADAARGLAAAHALGVLHRDVKPENILVDHAPAARVVDFGLATLAGRQGALTATGACVGTPAYMAPEVLVGGAAAASAAGDVYALGAILFEGLAGRHPFLDPGAPPADLLARIVAGAAAPLPADAPAPLALACRDALATDPGARPTAAALAERLALFADGAVAPRAAPPPRAPARLGPYVLEGALAAGGMGVVHVGRHETLGVRRAIKVCRGASPRFEREAQALARVPAHVGVVAIHDAGATGDVAWLAMDLVEGAPLSRRMNGAGLPASEALSLLAAVGDALAHLHAHGLVHRDLKPDNVIVRPDGGPVLIDLGVVRDLDATALTASRHLVGTPACMAPEQAAGASVGPAADVWALGVLAYEALCGAPPFDAPSLHHLLAQVMRADAPRLPASAPPGADEVVRACLAREPGHRPTAVEVAAALRRVARGEPPGLAARRAPMSARAAAVVLAAALGLVALFAAALRAGTTSPPTVPGAVAAVGGDPYLAEGERALARGDLAEAARALARIRRDDPRRGRFELDLCVAQARARAATGDLAGALVPLRRARDVDPDAAARGLEVVVEDIVRARAKDPVAAVAALDCLETAWPRARLPRAAVEPLVALAGRRLAATDDAGALTLAARARRIDPEAGLPAGLGAVVLTMGKSALALERFDEAASALIQGTWITPAVTVSDHDLEKLAADGALERALARSGDPAALLWVGAGEAALAEREPGRELRVRLARRAEERLSRARLALPPAAAVIASEYLLRAGHVLDGTRTPGRVEELAAAAGADGWRIIHRGARLLREEPELALPFARRAEVGAPGASREERADVLEQLVTVLIDADRLDEAQARLAGPAERELLGADLAPLEERCKARRAARRDR